MVLKVDLGERSYDIVIEKGSLNRLDSLLELDRKVLIVSDDGIPTKYINAVKKQCKSPFVYIFPQGEKNKNLKTYEKIISFLVENDFSRKDAVIALGGGLTSDIAGFVASTYMRGMDFYPIPTTLLSQVDASVGGKVAINHQGIKNLIGAFYQPKKVIIDVSTLETLTVRLFNEGLAEAIKMGATNSIALFELIENSKNIKADIENVVTMAVNIKKGIVEKDEKEDWLRQTLNFGHTVGHAIESLSKGKLYHGECVAIGMLYFTAPECRERLKNVLLKYKLPVTDNFTADELIELIKHDKKVNDGFITTCYVENLGANKLRRLTINEVKDLIKEYKEQ